MCVRLMMMHGQRFERRTSTGLGCVAGLDNSTFQLLAEICWQSGHWLITVTSTHPIKGLPGPWCSCALLAMHLPRAKAHLARVESQSGQWAAFAGQSWDAADLSHTQHISTTTNLTIYYDVSSSWSSGALCGTLLLSRNSYRNLGLLGPTPIQIRPPRRDAIAATATTVSFHSLRDRFHSTVSLSE